MTRNRNAQTKMIRVGQILRIFMERENVSSTWLSKNFQTTPRTIQRDLLLLKESGFPIYEIQKGNYLLSKDLVKNLEVFDDTELALVVALKSIVGQLGQPFQNAANSVLNSLYDCVTNMPVFVKINDAVHLDNALLNRIVKAIREKRQISFQYAAKQGAHPVNLEPYRVAYFSGFWYLIGNEPDSGKHKRYAMDKIDDLRLLKASFKSVPENLDAILLSSANIWFEEESNLEVVVLVDKAVSDYFSRRKMYPTQEIREVKPDGSLVVIFRVGNYESIRDILKSWIPHIVILEPDEFRKALLKDVKTWVKQQENIVY